MLKLFKCELVRDKTKFYWDSEMFFFSSLSITVYNINGRVQISGKKILQNFIVDEKH